MRHLDACRPLLHHPPAQTSNDKDTSMTSTCDCDDMGDEVAEHDGHCPRNYDDLYTADDIAAQRLTIMTFRGGGTVDIDCGQTIQGCMALGVTARAVELGLEPA